MLSVPQRYRQTDRQTDGRTTYDSNTALALRASRGKKHVNPVDAISPWWKRFVEHVSFKALDD